MEIRKIFYGALLIGPMQVAQATGTCEWDSPGEGSVCGGFSKKVAPVVEGLPYSANLVGGGVNDLLGLQGEGIVIPPPTGEPPPFPCDGACESDMVICTKGNGLNHSLYSELNIYTETETRYSHFEFGVDATGQQSLNRVSRQAFFDMQFYGATSDSRASVTLFSKRETNGQMLIVVERTSGTDEVVDVQHVLAQGDRLLLGTASDGDMLYMYVMTASGIVLTYNGTLPVDKLPAIVSYAPDAFLPMDSDVIPETIGYGKFPSAPFFDLDGTMPMRSLVRLTGFWKLLGDEAPQAIPSLHGK